jgi:hypothetical protein
MLRSLFLLALLCIFSNIEAQLNTFLVSPYTTDTAYSIHQDSSYVAYDSAVPTNGKLMLFIGGTSSHTIDYTDFVKLSAELGYHSIEVAYPDTPEVGNVCKNSPDSLCYYRYRQQKCFGTPVSTANIDTLNSIVMRTYNLLAYLNSSYPTAGWGQFISGGEIVWSKVAICGHSQGSGHALFISKQMGCERVLMFSGVDDYSLYYNRPAQWIYYPGATSAAKLFGLQSLGNEGVPYDTLYRMEDILGMTAYGDSISVDSNSPPYRYSRCLYSDATPDHPGASQAHHQSTVANFCTPLTASGTPLYIPVWTYMLDISTDSIYRPDTTSTGIYYVQASTVSVYPNPATHNITLRWADKGDTTSDIALINGIGQTVLQRSMALSSAPTTIPLPALPAGMYMLRIQNGNRMIQTKVAIVGE